MKAMVLEKPAAIETSPLQYGDFPKPEPGDGEIRVRIRCCAVCRTDLHVIEGELPPQKNPVIPGHQIIGTVDAMGPGCRGLNLGKRVGVAWLRSTCGVCAFCQDGRENLCEKARFTGYHENGGYAEFVIAPADYVYEIPNIFSDAEAAPLLCAGIIGYRALKRSRFKPKGTLALFGFGSSAHIVTQIAKYRQAGIYVVTRDHHDLARKMGATWVGSHVQDMPVKVESAILFAPVGSLVPDALAGLARGGTLALADIFMSPIPSLDYEKHLFYEKEIRSVTANVRQDGRELLAEAASANVHAVTTSYRLRDANRALMDLKQGRINGTAVLTMESLYGNSNAK